MEPRAKGQQPIAKSQKPNRTMRRVEFVTILDDGVRKRHIHEA